MDHHNQDDLQPVTRFSQPSIHGLKGTTSDRFEFSKLLFHYFGGTIVVGRVKQYHRIILLF
jgi:hypothetical protein